MTTRGPGASVPRAGRCAETEPIAELEALRAEVLRLLELRPAKPADDVAAIPERVARRGPIAYAATADYPLIAAILREPD